MTNINIKDSEKIEIRAVTLECSDEFQRVKFIVRLKNRGEENWSARKFGIVIPYDSITSGEGQIAEGELIPVIESAAKKV
jgi:hypothetical protein